MSHVTDVKLCVKDLDAVEETLAEKFPQLELRRNKRTFKWYGRWMNDFHGDNAAVDQGYDPKEFGKCEHTIGFKNSTGAYEIGLVKAKTGDGWNVIYDAWGGALDRVVGRNAVDFKREYAATVAVRRAKQTLAKKGFTTTREDLPGGKIRIKLRKR